MGKLVDSKYEINETDPNFVLGSDVPVGEGDGVTESIYGTYTVPDGVDLVFLAQSIFMFYGKDVEAAPAELTDYVPIRIVHKDNSNQGTLQRLAARYVTCKFTADEKQQKKFDDKFKAKAKEQLEIRVIADDTLSLDVSACHFVMTCRRVAPQLTP